MKYVSDLSFSLSLLSSAYHNQCLLGMDSKFNLLKGNLPSPLSSFPLFSLSSFFPQLPLFFSATLFFFFLATAAASMAVLSQSVGFMWRWSYIFSIPLVQFDLTDAKITAVKQSLIFGTLYFLYCILVIFFSFQTQHYHLMELKTGLIPMCLTARSLSIC